MNLFVFGSSILSSYWNGAATYYRGIYKYLSRRGHEITFAEPDAYGRQQHLDADDYTYIRSVGYRPGVDIDEMLRMAVKADVVIKHSGIGVDDEELELRVLTCRPKSIVVFWDVDAPATIARMDANPQDAFCRAVPLYDAILTYGGGPAVRHHYLSRGARAYYSIYNGLDPETHYPVVADPSLASDLVFLGNRLPDRETRVDELFLRAARLSPHHRFLLGGEGWGDKKLPRNVRWIGHVPTADHNRVNCSSRMVLNINRASMASFGFSPPTRVFEVAGTGTCLLCDEWPGIEDCFAIGDELLIVKSAEDVVAALQQIDNCRSHAIGKAFLERALRDHTYEQR
ncbi:MAG TPA: glycosyltransferase, partial [Acidobacteriaceae bacterium]